MPSRIANGLIAIGGLGIFMGFVVMLSGRAGHPDSAIVMMGACALSLGSLLAAGGMYVKAKSVQGTVSPRSSAVLKSQPRRIRGGCDICHGEIPIVHCRVHQVHMCTDCMDQHFDPRSCTYAPSTRRQVAKAPRSSMARAGA